MKDLENEFTNLDFEEEVYDELPDFCYVQLQGWMVKLAHKYELALNEMMIYAVIHSFSQDGVSSYRGSRDYLRLWAFCGRTSVFGKVKKLLDLNLIGKEYVTYKGRNFPIYFTFASREALKRAVFRTKEKEKMMVQNLNLNGQKQPLQFKNCTESVQKLNSNSSKSGPNNNLNNDLNNAAVNESQKSQRDISGDSAAAAFISKKIKELFVFNTFTQSYIAEISEGLKQKGLIDKRAGEYLDFVMEKVRSKNPASVPALFKTLVLAEDVISDFVLKHPVKEEKYYVCPVCGEKNYNAQLRCFHCDFDFTDSFDEAVVEKFKRIYNMSPEDQQKRDEEICVVLSQFKLSDFTNSENIKKRNSLLNEIDRKYMLIA